MPVTKDARAFALILLFIYTTLVQSQEPDGTAQVKASPPVTPPVYLGDPHWVKFDTNTRLLPPDAIIGGFENENLYIIRADHEGSLTPGKYVPSKQEAILSWGSGTHVKNDFEVLCGYNYIWVETTTDNIPAGAVIGGYIEKTNEPLYVGRAKYSGHVIPGKVAKSHGLIVLPYGENEVSAANFEILVVAEKKKPKLSGKAKVTVTKGKPVNIECKIVEGVPPPKISWQFKDNANTNFAAIPGSGNVLRIAKVGDKDIGVYKCVANNAVGNAEHLTSLTIKSNTDNPHWVQFNGEMPTDAIVGGYENENLYIIRSQHEGSLTPGKFVPSKNQAIISWGGRTHVKDTYEILRGSNYKWVATTTANIPPGSVIGGYIENTKEPLYVGRARFEERVIPGKIAVSHRVCFVPLGENEVIASNFEILVAADKTEKPKLAGKATETAIKGESVNIECNVVEGVPPPNISWHFKASAKKRFQTIAGSNNVLTIFKVDDKDAGVYKCVANNALGNAEHLTTLNVLSSTNDPHWVQYNGVLPTDAIIGGYENENLYIIRSPHEGSLTPGKFIPSKNQAIISWGARTYVKNTFQILCGSNYRWVDTTTGNMPAEAVIGGFIENTKEPLYVGRGMFSKSQVIPGKVAKSHGVIYLPYGDNEIQLPNFEVLVATGQTQPTQPTQPIQPTFPTQPTLPTQPSQPLTGELNGSVTNPALPPAECKPTVTKLRSGKACAGQTLFEDNFDIFNENVWQIEQYIPTSSTEFPFVSYQTLSEDPTVSVTEGNLRIVPKLQQNLPGFSEDSIYTGCLDLFSGCTSSGDACKKEAWGANILPPVVSGKITSKGFAFTYGTVYVRAKLPQGDWLYPEILLEPFLKKYGGMHYSSGFIRIAAARGNKELSLGVRDYSNKALYGGPVMDFQCHDFLLSSISAPGGRQWGDDFHEYAVRWEPERIVLSVDGVEWTRVEPATSGLVGRFPQTCGQIPRKQLESGSKMAPFDDHFYLSLGVAAGSITEFPDNVQTTGWRQKPWINPSSKAILNFWKDMDAWFATWNQPQLLVDYVKVVAL